MSKRRAKGDGSVFTRKDGRVVREWENANGRTRYMTSTKMSEAVRLKLQDRDEGKAHDSEGLTVERHIERWLESTRDTVGLRTYQRSEETARLHITPALGNAKLENLTVMQLDGLYRKKLKAGLSPRSVQLIRATAHKMLKQAHRWKMVRENVAEHAPEECTQRDSTAHSRANPHHADGCRAQAAAHARPVCTGGDDVHTYTRQNVLQSAPLVSHPRQS